MTHYLILILIPACFCCNSHAAAAGFFMAGARQAAMGNAAVAIYDPWAISHNQAGITGITAITAGLDSENRFLLPEMTAVSASCLIPTPRGSWGVIVSMFGSTAYKEGKAGITYARRFGQKLSAAAQLSYLTWSIGDGYGRTATLAAEFGIIYELLPNLRIGSHLFNPGRSSVTTHEAWGITEEAPVILRTGLSYTLSKNVLINLEAEKDIRHDPVARIGVEYRISDTFVVRTGLSTNPMKNAFGAGVVLGRLHLDIASTYHHLLGYSPRASISYVFD